MRWHETPEVRGMSTSWRVPTDTELSEELGFVHKNHMWWHQAPLPRRWHRCTVWSSGPVRGRVVQRCACGGIRWLGESTWIERNSRRRDK
jgi:hypothetical protein